MLVDFDKKAEQLSQKLLDVRRRILKPPSTLTAEEWAEQFRRIGSDAGAVPGPFRISTFEVARGPIRAINEPGVSALTIVASAQICKTTTCETAIGYFMQVDPAPIALFQPSDNVVSKFNREKLEPMILSTPTLSALWGGAKALEKKRDDFTDRFKKFPGGSLTIASAETAKNLASSSFRCVMYDEVDKMSITKDGDPISLGDERLKLFADRSLSIRVSTPTDEHSRIMREYRKSDQRKPAIICPGCGELEFLEWENVHFKNEDGVSDAESAFYACSQCGTVYSEADRIKPLTTKGGVIWLQTRQFTCCDEVQNPVETRTWDIEDGLGHACCKHCGERALKNNHAGFLANELYHPRVSIKKLVSAWLDAQTSREELQNFVNSKLARVWKTETDAVFNMKSDDFSVRAEPFWTHLPDGVSVITAGADVQPDRIEAEIVGWGQGEESWSLDYIVIEGDTNSQDVFDALDDFLLKSYEKQNGQKLSVQAACIDARHNVDSVLEFCHSRRRRRVFATMSTDGAAGTRKPLWPRKVTLKKSGRSKGSSFYSIGSQSGKDKVGSHMSVSEPGPGYMHVPANRDSSWFKMMTSEVKTTVVMAGGRIGYYWKKKANHSRNEAFDCRVYALAALHSLKSTGVYSAAVTSHHEKTAENKADQDREIKKKRAKKKRGSDFFGNQSLF